jgi:DNA-binding MurR/RpiR family transcriptional regulator
MAIRDLLDRDITLTPSEQKIAQILLCDYPVSGLGTQSGLARRAGVSDPTVVRFVTKLGFDGFTEFQGSLLDEVEARLRSPLMMIEAKRRPDNRSVAQTYLASVADRIVDAESATMAQSYDRAINLIMVPKAQILVAGGRFSRHVAGMLGAYLSQLRPGVTALGPLSTESFDALLDLGRRDVLIVFDYRRYQTDTVALATQAAARGVRIVLFTDPWMSPVAELAEVVLVAPVEVDSPYDSLAPAVAQMEALVAEAVTRHGAQMHPRVADLEVLRSGAGATLDGSTSQSKVSEMRK